LSREKILKILVKIGLPPPEAQVYLHLAIKGPKKAEDLENALQIPALQLRSSLERLQEKGAVTAAPASFVALPFERMLNSLAKARLEEARDMEEKKYTILAQWRSFVKRNT
jgi:sugar-specific transcriptional regulator TrmB